MQPSRSWAKPDISYAAGSGESPGCDPPAGFDMDNVTDWPRILPNFILVTQEKEGHDVVLDVKINQHLSTISLKEERRLTHLVPFSRRKTEQFTDPNLLSALGSQCLFLAFIEIRRSLVKMCVAVEGGSQLQRK